MFAAEPVDVEENHFLAGHIVVHVDGEEHKVPVVLVVRVEDSTWKVIPYI